MLLVVLLEIWLKLEFESATCHSHLLIAMTLFCALLLLFFLFCSGIQIETSSSERSGIHINVNCFLLWVIRFYCCAVVRTKLQLKLALQSLKRALKMKLKIVLFNYFFFNVKDTSTKFAELILKIRWVRRFKKKIQSLYIRRVVSGFFSCVPKDQLLYRNHWWFKGET